MGPEPLGAGSRGPAASSLESSAEEEQAEGDEKGTCRSSCFLGF